MAMNTASAATAVELNVYDTAGKAVPIFMGDTSGQQVVVGETASVDGRKSVAVGHAAKTEAGVHNATAIGGSALAHSNYSIAVGASATAKGLNSVSIGDNNTRTLGDRSIAIGSGAKTGA